LDEFFDKPEESIVADVYEAVNKMDISTMVNLTQQEKRIIRASEISDASGNEKRFFLN